VTNRDDLKQSRDVTDAKLRAERQRTDEEILDRSTARGETADEVIRRARASARVILERARSVEDRGLDDAHASPSIRTGITNEQKLADEVLAAQYAEADAAVLDERVERRRAIIQLLALERDETDERLTVERRVADRMVGLRDDVLRGVTHDIRNHLSALLVRVAAVRLVHAEEPKLVEHMQIMQHSITQMHGMLKELMDVASPETRPLRVDGAETDLAVVVSDETRLHQPIAEARSIRLTIHIDQAPIMVRLDASRMSRVVMNVLTNALKFTPPGGQIRVAVSREANEACISVSDTGPGIPADQLQTIFERFVRGDTQTRGYGLGLYIARAVVNAHGGRIWAESVLGEGATFHIRLPMQSAPG
jgi:signal transduction histidine kinase